MAVAREVLFNDQLVEEGLGSVQGSPSRRSRGHPAGGAEDSHGGGAGWVNLKRSELVQNGHSVATTEIKFVQPSSVEYQ